MEETFTDLRLSSYSISFLTDDLIRLRYVEIEGALRKILMVVKMRGGSHSTDIRGYDISAAGIVLGQRLTGFSHLITGLPERVQDISNLQPRATSINPAKANNDDGVDRDS